ncbi:MAG TPA: ABC transporter substrate-binding protein [Pseudonocardia sp.]|uniref:ABC transporter substrate-binding protein n=1 Tax=Pseudonocardia sp. TaxID=60912 RepID=UPI002B4B88B4|nr:ABC transporter substrate-binding protein [Pseudonocardia sp.]HLU60368.1 ABC transporter substrate-binding protein [Pseudonocardia sp.]
MKGSRKLLAATAAVLAALSVGCANTGSGAAPGASAPEQDAGPLKIGVIVPLSGPAGPNGAHVLEAIEVMADLVNSEGGCAGRQVEVVSRDDQSTPAAGVSAANDLIAEGVDVVMGGWNSPVTLAIQPVLVRAGILNITTIPQNASILGGADPAAIRMNAGNEVGAHVAARYIADTLQAKRVAMLLQNDAYGNDAGAALRAELEKRGVEVVAEQTFAFTDTDFRIPLSNIAAANPDVVFSANAAESSGMPAMARQYAESGIPAVHFAGTGTVSPTVIELAGGAVIDGLVSADLYFPDVEPFRSLPRNEAFVQAYTQRSGGDLPDKYRALGAQSVDIWCKAVEKAGTTERLAVADAIQGESFTDTVLGDVRFTEEGQQEFAVYAFTVEGGKTKVLEEIPVDEAVWG